MADNTHFGYKNVETHKKQKMVADVFDSVANKYDIMNDLMSLGIHRFWKHYTVLSADVRPDMNVLDLASGTCDLAIRMGKKLNGTGHLVASDINENMLNIGKERMVDNGLLNNIDYQIANAEELPFENNQFDLVTMAFGLRNVTDKPKALSEIYRTLKVGGKCLVLEFSRPPNTCLDSLYEKYLFNVVPQLGQLVAGDKESYQYLSESIRMHPDQETLKQMFVDAGFEIASYQNLSHGIVALHKGIKI